MLHNIILEPNENIVMAMKYSEYAYKEMQWEILIHIFFDGIKILNSNVKK